LLVEAGPGGAAHKAAPPWLWDYARPGAVQSNLANAGNRAAYSATLFTMRVLIVDDEPSIRKTTGLAVEAMGHESTGVPNGLRALKEIETEPFDACFLDLKLGTEDGLVVLEKLLKA
jgi:PleD family two-component response regulator